MYYFLLNTKKRKIQNVFFFGSILFCFQYFRYVLNEACFYYFHRIIKNEGLRLQLIFANQSENDILLREELEAFRAQCPGKFDLWFTIDRSVSCSFFWAFLFNSFEFLLIYFNIRQVKPDWPYDVGFVNADMIAKHLPPPGDDTIILMCGPPPMINFACTPALDTLGFSKEMRFAY